ncbi:MAG: peroxiredoxin [Bdellovibrionales bacterium]
MKKRISKALALVVSTLSAGSALAVDLKINDEAPAFTTQTHEGQPFDLKSRKGQWTVLYFYPKADTPGCTKQACTFRDHIEKIRVQGADVFGVSSDSVEAQAAFHKKNHLNFTLLADPKGDIVNLYGTKMPIVKISKRWTFVLDPDLKIRQILKDVDPVKDSVRIADLISSLKKAP